MLCAALSMPMLIGIDNAHFYKVPHAHGIGTHDTSDWFAKLDLNYGYGSARSGYNYKGSKTSLLNIYGDQNIAYLGAGVPKALPANYQVLLQNLILGQTTSTNFAKLKFNGKFQIHDFNLDYRQNFVNGFFGEVHLPIRNVKINDISYTDLSPATGAFSKTNANWIQVKNNLNSILNLYGIKDYNSSKSKTALGDLSLLAGWQTTNDKEFDFLKYYSIALRTGILFPTSAKDDTSYAFSVPTGNFQHWGIPARFDLLVGAMDWLQIGAHVGATFFFDKTYNQRLKTNTSQSGFIKLAEDNTKVDKGTLWDLGAYLNFDHFFKGLSALAGYSYNRKEHDELSPVNTSLFTDNIVNSDNQYKEWEAHVIHLMLEYDFGNDIKDTGFAPRVNIHYDFPVDGKNIFATDVFGGGIGLDIKWDF